MAKPAHDIEITERRRRAIDMRNAGAQWQAIADELGYASRGAAYTDVVRALAAARAGMETTAAEYRDAEVAKLDQLEAEAVAVLLADHEDDGVTLRAVQTVLRIAERRAKLLGLDSPDRLTLTAPVVVRHVLAGIDLDDL